MSQLCLRCGASSNEGEIQHADGCPNLKRDSMRVSITPKGVNIVDDGEGVIHFGTYRSDPEGDYMLTPLPFTKEEVAEEKNNG